MKKDEIKYKNCYNGTGIHRDFYLKLLSGNGRSQYRSRLNLPLPENNNEIKLLTKFIFGVEIGLRSPNDASSHAFKVYDNSKYYGHNIGIQNERAIKLAELSGDIGIKCDNYGIMINKQQYDKLCSIMYMADVSHSDYYDSPFNRYTHNSSYEVDSTFWRTVFETLSCGGIGGYSYGQVDFATFEQRSRMHKILDQNLFTK